MPEILLLTTSTTVIGVASVVVALFRLLVDLFATFDFTRATFDDSCCESNGETLFAVIAPAVAVAIKMNRLVFFIV